MVTINGVKAQNLQANQQENIKKPTMNEVLSRMQSNFDMANQNAQNQQKFSNNEQNQNFDSAQNKSPFDSLASMFQGENSILLSLLPMLLTKQKNANLGQEIMTKMLANSGNPMLAKLVGMLTSINKKTDIQNSEQQTTQASKIDDFARVEE